jgi:hypothetical protein
MFLHSQELVQLVFMPYWHQNVVILPQPWVDAEDQYPDGVKRKKKKKKDKKEKPKPQGEL